MEGFPKKYWLFRFSTFDCGLNVKANPPANFVCRLNNYKENAIETYLGNAAGKIFTNERNFPRVRRIEKVFLQ